MRENKNEMQGSFTSFRMTASRLHHFVQDDGVEASSLREGMTASELRTEKLSG
jgi:hypothetical protein